jgi:aspartate ammonia-lyase
MPRTAHRVEHDLLGERNVPVTAYYGIHTLRALENFPISGTSIALHGDLIIALACVKQACAIANQKLGSLDRSRARAIIAACEEIRDGKLHAQFVVDVIQGAREPPPT